MDRPPFVPFPNMHASGSLHKVLIKGDDLPKGAV